MSGRMTSTPHLLLEGAEDSLIVERTALHDDLPAQLFGAGRTDDLVQRVLDDADGQARRDILDGRAVLLGLLDRAVHKDGAAAAQIHGAVGEEAEGRELLDVVASACAKVCKKLPQPEEQASFRKMLLMAPSSILKHFIS